MNENRTQEQRDNRQFQQNRGDNRGDNRGQNPQQQGKPQQQQPEGPRVKVTDKYVSYGQYGQVSREVFDRSFQRMVRWEKRIKGIFDGVSRLMSVLERLWVTFCVTCFVGFSLWFLFKVIDIVEVGLTLDSGIQTGIVGMCVCGMPLLYERGITLLKWLRGK